VTKLDERGIDAVRELRREIASVPLPEPTRLVRRARRTRIATAAAAALVVGIGSLAVVRAVDSSSATRITTGSQPKTPTRPAWDTPPAFPIVEGADRGSTLLASWTTTGGGLREPPEPPRTGYVLVYADGRVIWSPQGGFFVDANGRVTAVGVTSAKSGPSVSQTITQFWVDGHTMYKGNVTTTDAGGRQTGRRGFVPEGEFRNGVIERRLSPRALELVRSGRVDPMNFVVRFRLDVKARIHWVRLLYQREELWAEPTARIWESSRYAICFFANGVAVRASDVVGELPESARLLLDSKVRTYNPNRSFARPTAADASWYGQGLVPGQPTECFEVNTADKSALERILNLQDSVPYTPQSGSVTSVAFPIYPHGQFVVG
jgi:hypothetical protein